MEPPPTRRPASHYPQPVPYPPLPSPPNRHPQATLSLLPHDLLLQITTLLPTASDLRSLALSCRSLALFVRHHGWRLFVRSHFSSLHIPDFDDGATVPYAHLAESLTWQSRAWDRRALQFQGLFPAREENGPRQQRARGAGYQPVLAVRLEEGSGREVVVWGAGEDLVARTRERGAEVRWCKRRGREGGHESGYGDVLGVAVVPWNGGGGEREVVLTGRDSGEVEMVWGVGERFGENVGVSFGWGGKTFGSLDVWGGRRMAVAGGTQVAVFELPVEGDLGGEGEEVEVRPSLVYDFGQEAFTAGRRGMQRPLVCRATWMEEGMMAVAVKGVDDPLRYLELTPTGWTHHTAVKSARMEGKFGIGYGNICPNSLTPVHPPGTSRGGTSLLLSAWRDGTIRLQDLRTPSPVDMVYQDNIDPWSDMEAVMTYGTERFLGGGMESPVVKIFDFRWSKGYQHTMGLPCSNQVPLPSPPQPFIKRPMTVGDKGQPVESCGSRCDYVRGTYCLWHGLSRDIYYRPNASFFLDNQDLHAVTSWVGGHSSVWALAKGSDVSPNFYIGLTGGVVEAALEPTGEENMNTQTDPHFGFADWHDPSLVGAGYRSVPIRTTMMETGDGKYVVNNDRPVRLPRLLELRDPTVGDADSRKRYRLDPKFM